MIFKAVRDSAPYPDHGVTRQRDWSTIAPRQIRLDQLTTTRSTLDLRNLLDDDSIFFGDLFAHVCKLHFRISQAKQVLQADLRLLN